MKLSRKEIADLVAKGGILGPQTKLPSLTLVALPPDVSEKDFQAAVKKLAERNGWTCYHTFDSRRSDPGFVDLWMAKDRILHVELKSETGQLTADQLRFRDAILAAKGIWYCWRPSDWPTIVNVLCGRD